MAAEKKAKKKASKPAGPSCFVKVCEAIKAKKGTFGRGVSRSFIYKHIGDNYSGTSVAAVRRAISKAVADGLLETGATKQRFKLTDAGKKKIAPPKPKKKKKKAAKKKKASKKKRKKTVKRKSSKKKKAKKRTSKRKSAKRKSAKRRPAKRSSKKKTKKRTSKKRRAAAKK